MVRALVLPSPLLPALAYVELADALTRAGWSARVAAADLGEGEGAGDLVERWAGEVGLSDVLVAHSNAGYLAPLVRETAPKGWASRPSACHAFGQTYAEEIAAARS